MTRRLPALLLVLSLAASSWSQSPPREQDPAASAEEQARQRMAALEETMNRLAALLEDTEPTSAQRLREAYARAREAFILQHMEEILGLLRTGALEQALSRHEDVSAKLQMLLTLLQSGALDEEALRQEMERLQDLARELTELERQERALQGASEALAGAEAGAEACNQAGRKQESTREQTEQVGERMQEPGPDGSPAPGSGQVQQAVSSMQEARSSLNRQEPAAAAEEQGEAADQLAEARRELEARLEELRNQMQQDLLLDLQALLREMLDTQRRLTLQTSEADTRLGPPGGRQLERRDRLLLGGLARGERELGEDATGGKEALEEEGTAAVFPFALELLIAHLVEAARLLEELETGPPTRTQQQQAETLLEELLATLERELEARQGNPGGGGT